MLDFLFTFSRLSVSLRDFVWTFQGQRILRWERWLQEWMRVSEMISNVVFLALDDSIGVDGKALFQERFEKVYSSANAHRGREK